MATPLNSTIQPYLCFEGRCEEAIDFYKHALGAEVQMMMRFKESPEPLEQSGCMANVDPEKVMHASLIIGNAVVMASDGQCSSQPKFEGISLSYSAKDEGEAHKRFDALAKEGQVMMPLGKTFYSPCFGMVTDKFGVTWMVIVPQEM